MNLSIIKLVLILGTIVSNNAFDNRLVDISSSLDCYGASEFRLSNFHLTRRAKPETVTNGVFKSPSKNKRINPRKSRGKIIEAKRFAVIAGTAYCEKKKVEMLKCHSCQKLRQAKLKYEYYNEKHNLKAFFFVNEKHEEIILAIRGSDGMSQAMELVSMEAIRYTDQERVQVYSEFQIRLNVLMDPINRILYMLFEDYKNFRLVITGHSLGGAMAVLAAPKLKENFKLPYEKIAVYTYGQPRVGNIPFATWYTELDIYTIRTVNKNDVVPLALPHPNFYHAGQEIYVNGNIRLCNKIFKEDISCSLGDEKKLLETLSSYKKNLLKAIPKLFTIKKYIEEAFTAHNTAYNITIGNNGC